MKKIFLVLISSIFSILSFSGNRDNFNKFEKFSMRMAIVPVTYSVSFVRGSAYYSSQLNVGNYLSFRPTKTGSIDIYEFFSDILQKDFRIISVSKKGKVSNKTDIIKFDENDFYSNYKEGVLSDRAEVKSLGIVLAGVKITNNDEYKITQYATPGVSVSVSGNSVSNLTKGVAGLLSIPTNSAFYIKKLSDTKIVWSPNKDYNSIQYTFTIENGKVVGLKKNKPYMTLYVDGNSLFLDLEKNTFEYRVNTQLSQFEYYKNGKLVSSEKYQVVE